eukprot:3097117-Pleurochrysis_carterae.AAC.1
MLSAVIPTYSDVDIFNERFTAAITLTAPVFGTPPPCMQQSASGWSPYLRAGTPKSQKRVARSQLDRALGCTWRRLCEETERERRACSQRVSHISFRWNGKT